MSSKLYVGNLAIETRQNDLELLFSGSGTVLSSLMVCNRESDCPHGFAFLTMSTSEEAHRAAQRFNGHTLHGQPLTVSEIHQHEPPIPERG